MNLTAVRFLEFVNLTGEGCIFPGFSTSVSVITVYVHLWRKYALIVDTN